MIFHRMKLLTVVSVGHVLFANSAFALDGADVLKKLNGAMVAQIGDSIEAGNIDVNGSTVTLRNVTYTPRERDGITLGDVTMTGVAERSGGYTIEKILIPDVTIEQKNLSVSVTGLRVDDLAIPANAALNDIDSVFTYRAHIGPVSALKSAKSFSPYPLPIPSQRNVQTEKASIPVSQLMELLPIFPWLRCL